MERNTIITTDLSVIYKNAVFTLGYENHTDLTDSQ